MFLRTVDSIDDCEPVAVNRSSRRLVSHFGALTEPERGISRSLCSFSQSQT
jgi:hypothetical protein